MAYRILESAAELKMVRKEMVSAFRKHGVKAVSANLGFQGENINAQALWAADLGIWYAPAVIGGSRYWRLSSVRSKVDTGFSEWLQRRFGSLYSLPATPPVMVHHIARFLAAERDDTGLKGSCPRSWICCCRTGSLCS